MPAMATAVTGYGETANTRTYTYTGHTLSDPRLVIQKRKVAVAADGTYENSITVVTGIQDASGVTLSKNAGFEIRQYGPKNGIAADVTAALAIIRDIVASDEFTTVTTTQNWIKG